MHSSNQSDTIMMFKNEVITSEVQIMPRKFIEIEDTTQGFQGSLQQDLKFKTGKFVWRARFTTTLDPSTINTNTMYVTDEAGNKIKAAIRYDDSINQIEVEPLQAYAQDAYYFLNITTKVKSRGGQRLKEPVQIKFKISLNEKKEEE